MGHLLLFTASLVLLHDTDWALRSVAVFAQGNVLRAKLGAPKKCRVRSVLGRALRPSTVAAAACVCSSPRLRPVCSCRSPCGGGRVFFSLLLFPAGDLAESKRSRPEAPEVIQDTAMRRSDLDTMFAEYVWDM